MEINPREWEELKAQVKSMFNILTGNDPLNKHLPLMERIARLENWVRVIRIMLIAFAIGLLVGALIFGAITFRQFLETVKHIKP